MKDALAAGATVGEVSDRLRTCSEAIGPVDSAGDIDGGYRPARIKWQITRTHLLIIGGGPAGTQAATTAASKGARVTLIEKDIVGGAAHLWDCIPSKTMAASALRHTSIRNAAKLGFVTEVGRVDPKVLAERIEVITGDINRNWVRLLESQGVDHDRRHRPVRVRP